MLLVPYTAAVVGRVLFVFFLVVFRCASIRLLFHLIISLTQFVCSGILTLARSVLLVAYSLPHPFLLWGSTPSLIFFDFPLFFFDRFAFLFLSFLSFMECACGACTMTCHRIIYVLWLLHTRYLEYTW